MPVGRLLVDPDPLLREVSKPITTFDQSVHELTRDLRDTLTASAAIGLSAPQIGVLQRALVVHVPDDEFGLQIYLNPKILAKSTPGFIEETCLSLPAVKGSVIRATRLRVRAAAPDGREYERDVHGMHAVCLQHEIDHLDGTLFVDRLFWWQRLRLKLAAATLPHRAAPGLAAKVGLPQR